MNSKRQVKKHYHVTAGLIFNNGKILIARRPEGRHLAGMWEFPGGKREGDETLETCMEREIKEELDIDVKAVKLLISINHEYDTKNITLHLFECVLITGSLLPMEGQEIRWVTPADLSRYTFPPPDREIIEYILLEYL